MIFLCLLVWSSEHNCTHKQKASVTSLADERPRRILHREEVLVFLFMVYLEELLVGQKEKGKRVRWLLHNEEEKMQKELVVV
jgi:hypothetical protein